MLCERLGALKSTRYNFDNQWQEARDLLWPDTAGFTDRESPGEKTNLQIFDIDPAFALERGAAVLETFLTPRTQRWHRTRASDPKLNEFPRVKEWFESLDDQLFMMRNNPRARFDNNMHEGWKSLLMTGNACTYVYTQPNGNIGYRNIHIGSAWIDCDYDGTIDTVFYEYMLSAKAAVQRWGADAPKVARDCVGKNPYKEHRYLHVVMPNDRYVIGSKVVERARFVAWELCTDDKTVLEVSGYHEMPYIWSRYTVMPGEKYGRGPAMLCLPDIKTLNEMEKTFLRSGQKVADPPLLTVDDGELGRGEKRISLRAGGITVGGLDSQGRPMVSPLVTGARLDITHEMQQERRQRIRSAFFLDIWEILAQDRVQMTATEFLGRLREKGQLLSPVVGRQQSEKLGPLIEREIAMLQRMGRVDDLPPELLEAQGEYEIVYESDATRMQQAQQVEAFPRLFESLGPLFQANPSLLSIFKSYETITKSFEVLGGSSRLYATKAEWEKIQQALAQAEQEATLERQAPIAAQTLKDLAAARNARAA